MAKIFAIRRTERSRFVMASWLTHPPGWGVAPGKARMTTPSGVAATTLTSQSGGDHYMEVYPMSTVADRIETIADLVPENVVDEVGVPGHVDVCFVCWEVASECVCYAEPPRAVRSEIQRVG
jgi:hypothetical protein